MLHRPYENAEPAGVRTGAKKEYVARETALGARVPRTELFGLAGNIEGGKKMTELREEEVLKELLQLLQEFDGEFERMYRLLEKILDLLDRRGSQEAETYRKKYFEFLQELCRIKAVNGQYALDTKELLERLEQVQACVPADSGDQPDDEFFSAEPGMQLDSEFFGAETKMLSDREKRQQERQTWKSIILPGRQRREGKKTPACFCHCCGAEVAADAMFCQNCGARVSAAATAAPPLTAAAPKRNGKTKTGLRSPKPAQRLTVSRVSFSAVAPRVFVKGGYSMVHLIMYEKEFRKIVDEVLADAETAVRETRSGVLKVREEDRIRVALSSPELEDSEEEQIWQGEYMIFRFAVRVPEDFRAREISFTASVYINDLIATKLKFIAKCSSWREQKLRVSREDVLSAFVSYASQDRKRVARVIQGMKLARPDMDIFFDVESLRSGENWQEALHAEIDRRDVLFLCWSHFAKQSRWVDTEWRYALEQKGEEGIEPIPLEKPETCPPPEELSRKHFNERLLFIIHAGSSVEEDGQSDRYN